MFIISVIIFLILNSNFEYIVNVEIPIVYIASNLGVAWKYIFGLYLLIAIFTTAISSGYGFLNNIIQSKTTFLKLAMGMCFISIIFRAD